MDQPKNEEAPLNSRIQVLCGDENGIELIDGDTFWELKRQMRRAVFGGSEALMNIIFPTGDDADLSASMKDLVQRVQSVATGVTNDVLINLSYAGTNDPDTLDLLSRIGGNHRTWVMGNAFGTGARAFNYGLKRYALDGSPLTWAYHPSSAEDEGRGEEDLDEMLDGFRGAWKPGFKDIMSTAFSGDERMSSMTLSPVELARIGELDGVFPLKATMLRHLAQCSPWKISRYKERAILVCYGDEHEKVVCPFDY